MTIQEIDQLGDKILNEHGINNAKNLGLQACHEALRLAVENERLQAERDALSNQTGDGGVSEVETEWHRCNKETAMLWKALDEARVEVERLQGVISQYRQMEERGKIIPVLAGECVYVYEGVPCRVTRVEIIDTFDGEEDAAMFYATPDRTYNPFEFGIGDIGRTVFLTKQEASQACAESEPTP